MAIFAQKAVIIYIFTGFLQVYFSQARYTEFVYGPQEHLDSGQVTIGEPFIPWTRKTFERDRPVFNYDSSEEDQYETEDGETVYENTQEKKTNEKRLLGLWFYEDDRDGNDDTLYSSESSEDEEDDTFQIPLNRVRRRIIPVGKALDRGRSDRNDPYGRSKSPWAEAPQFHNKQRDSIVNRNGPTGSEALFSLYPELAPPDWRARRGVEKKFPTAERNDEMATKNRDKEDPQTEDNESILKNDAAEATSKRHKIVSVPRHKIVSVPRHKKVSVKRHKIASVPRRKPKLQKHLKEEIAIFAEQHGVNKAVSHFSSRLNIPMKPEMVEKFLRRYQTRLQRRASRT